MNRSIIVEGLGTTCKITVTPGDLGDDADAQLFELLTEAWSRARVPDSVEANRTVSMKLTQESNTGLLTSTHPDYLLNSVTQSVTRRLIGQRIGELFMLHAAGLANPQTGDAVAFVAPGGTGKTTLAKMYGKRYAYISDETVGIDEERVIYPYVKPLSVVRDGLNKLETSPDALGLVHLQVRPKLIGIVILNRRPDVEGVKVEEMALFDAIIELASQTSSMYSLPDPLQYVARMIDEVDGVQKWTYSEASALGEEIEARLGVPE